MPEVTEKVFYGSRVKAILDEDELKLSVTLSAPYAPGSKRTAAVVIDSGFSKPLLKAVKDALIAVQKEKLRPSVQLAKEAALEAANYARKKGEEV